MGGGSKPAQRTKNNARPASSARCAELLGGTRTSFLGFSAAGASAVAFPVAPNDEITPEFQLVFKKLNKKDPITKCKALKEMSDLVKESSLEDVTSALGHWSRQYRTLTTDIEHRVREATQSTHGVIVSKCGRSIAPHLKQLMPTWLAAQYDNFAPAASNAQASLQSAFPEGKLPEVIAFCKVEVLSHISSNLVSTGQTASHVDKDLPAEVAEMHQQRVTIATLQGYDFFTKHLPDKSLEWLWAEQAEVLDSPRFWKLASDKCPQIKGAWFGVIARQIQRFPEQFAGKFGPKFTKLLLGNLVEKDPVVAMQLWDCFLLMTVNLQDWYTWVEKKDELSKRMLEVLENGGWGNAVHLSATILPLLANLPRDMLTNHFYTRFFVAMLSGLDKKAILASKSQHQACLTAVGECLRYLSVHEIDTFAVEIITSTLRTWLEKILDSPYPTQSRNNVIKYSASVMAGLVKYWLKQSNTNDKYDQIVRNFWQNKCSTLSHQIEKLTTDHDEISRCIEGHILLLQTLKVAFVQSSKKQVSIKFEIDATVQVQPTKDETVDAAMRDRYTHNLNNLVHETCSQYLQLADKKEITLPVFVPLFTLLNEFDSKELFATIAGDFATKGLYGLYDGVFTRWLAGDTMRCKDVVDMVFLLVPHLSSEERTAVFRSFNQLVPPTVEVCISKCLSHPYSSYDYVRAWMKSDLVDVSLAAICKRLVKNGDGHSKNLLLMSFAQDRNGDIVISENACSSILSILRESLTDLESPHLDMCASLSSQLVPVLLAEDKSDAYKRLLLEMFTLNATVKPNDDNLSEDTWWELKTSWQDGLSSMEEHERVAFIRNAIRLIQDTLLDSKEEIDLKKIDDIIQLSTSLMPNFNDRSDATESLLDIVTISKALFDEAAQPKTTDIEVKALTYSCLVGDLNCLFGDNEVAKAMIERSSHKKSDELNGDLLKSHVNKCLIRAKYLSTAVFGPEKKIEEDGVTEEGVDRVLAWSSTVLADGHIEECYVGLLHDCAVLQSLERAYSFSPHYDLISTNARTVDTILKEVTNQMSEDNERQYTRSITERAVKEGFFWSYARKYYESLTNKKNDVVLGKLDSENFESVMTGNGFFHSLQASQVDSADVKVKVMLRSFYLANVKRSDVIDEEFCKSCSGDTDDIDIVMNAYYKHNDVMLYDRNLIDVEWCHIVSNAAILDALTAKVKLRGWEMSAAQWDFVTISLSSLVHSLEKSKRAWGSTKVVLLARSVLELYRAADKFIASVPARCEAQQPSEHIADLPTEWRDIFLPDVTEHIYRLLLTVLDTSPMQLDTNRVVFLSSLAATAQRTGWARLPPHLRLGELDLPRVVGACVRALGAPGNHAVKYLAYYWLKTLTESLVKEDADKLNAWCEAAEQTEAVPERPKFSLQLFQETLCSLQDIVDKSLGHLRLGEESTAVLPFSDSHGAALGYLLLCEFVFGVCSTNHSELQQQYIEFFSHGKYLDYLMRNCFRMLPAEIIRRAQETNPQTSAPSHLNDYFTATQTFSATEPPVCAHVAALACRCLFLALDGVGAVRARGWYGALGGRLSKAVDRAVAAHVSPALIRRHFAGLQSRLAGSADITTTIHASVNEMVSEYSLDGRKMELRVQFSGNHPLSLPKVESTGTPVNHVQWLTMYLSYQNGELWQCVSMWADAMARKVQTSAVCYVCYCRMHPNTGQLPKVKCAQCKNRFHSQCLFKWLKTGPTAACPICRSTSIKNIKS